MSPSPVNPATAKPRRSQLPAVLAAGLLGLLLAGCVPLGIDSTEEPDHSAVIPEATPEQLARLPVWLRHGVAQEEAGAVSVYSIFYGNDERVLDQSSANAHPAFVNTVLDPHGGSRLYGTLFTGWNHKGLETMLGTARESRPGRIEYTTCFAARLRTAFNHPHALTLGGRPYWVVPSMVPGRDHVGHWVLPQPVRWFLTLELYQQDPAVMRDTGPAQGYEHQVEPTPVRLWTLAASADGGQTFVRWHKDAAYWLDGQVYQVLEASFDADGRWTALRIEPWQPPAPRRILTGQAGQSSVTSEAWPLVVQRTNDRLLEWKVKELPAELQAMPAAARTDFQLELEKALLDLDLRIQLLKDVLDEDARQVAAPGQAAPPPKASPYQAQVVRLYGQRKSIVAAVLMMVKQAPPPAPSVGGTWSK